MSHILNIALYEKEIKEPLWNLLNINYPRIVSTIIVSCIRDIHKYENESLFKASLK